MELRTLGVKGQEGGGIEVGRVAQELPRGHLQIKGAEVGVCVGTWGAVKLKC